MVMESKTTSKTSCLKALLLRAWRERWSDLQWGINIKTVLPRGVSGDVYNLADCILQQALVGAGANQLVLSYLRHSLSAQLVSHAAVLQRLSKYNQFSKIFCVCSLLEFLEKMIPGVTCCSKLEETELATAILSTASWLLNIIHNCRGPSDLNQRATILASSILKTILCNDFYISMICLARYNDTELFAETSQKCSEVLSFLPESDECYQYVKKLENIDVSMLSMKIQSETWPGCLIPYWLEVKLVGNPATSTLTLVEQLRLFQKLKGYNDARLFGELIRGSLLALYDVNETPHESQWGAFAFLKVPNILSELAKKSDSCSIVDSIELLLQHTPLLDAMDANSSCSSLECLLGELAKVRLLTDIQVKHLLEKRKMPKQIKLDNGNGTAGIPKVIICAEPTLNGILKTLSTDYHKDALLGMLHQVLAGKSFELILAVATVQGQLGTLVSRLIRFNECSKSGGDKNKAQLFDISFLMLVAIVQNFGANTVFDVDGNTLVEQWVKSCMVERNKPKAPEQLLRLGDPAMIESLLQQFNAGDTEMEVNVKWQDVLFNIPGVMHEVLVAWEQGALAASDVKRILDALRGRMCCLPLAAAAWLCAYMRTAQQDTVLKPINMVQQLLTPPTTDEENLGHRWQLTCEIIRKMQADVQLPLQAKSSHHLVSRQPAVQQLHQLWTKAITRGWLDHTSARAVHCLLETAGSTWLVPSVVHELCKLRYRDQLAKGVDLALAIFHVDIVSCTYELLAYVLPQLIYNTLQADLLKEPQMPSLARLTSYCIYTAYDALSGMCDEPSAKKMCLEGSQEITTEHLMNKFRQLFIMFDGGIQEGLITQQTYFAFHLIQSLVEVSSPSSSAILSAIPHALISDLLRTLPEEFSYSLLLNLHDVRTPGGKINMARDLCILRNHYLKSIPSTNTF
ncbi:mediator of RNA polymerase II transcription subunit 24 [Harmonia axyridis]|uniref:mediator of RNA polymerase II transcription subunit 24 n=1 Tax=Harmonia axyridis TaxID=115357 RepID=UPI001E278F7D|nr:mediator of RNA polymerase II transcription subunit 24 [Harmonia axyridis]